MEAMKEWWEQASSKDQLYVVICVCCLVLYIMYMAVFKPVKSMRDQQLTQNVAQAAMLERVKVLAAQVKSKKKGGGNSKGPAIDRMIQSSLAQHSLRATAVDSSGKSGLRVRLENISFEKFLSWMYSMEVQQGIKVDDLSLTTGSADGTVTINMRIQKD